MLLSFSVPEMRPYVEAGLRQMNGADIGDTRVKRQTIRKLDTRSKMLLAHDPIGHTIPYDLHLWWKSRTPQKAPIGRVPAEKVRVYAITFYNKGTECSLAGPIGWRIGRPGMRWNKNTRMGADFEIEAYMDGFDTPQAFCDYFVPNPGDVFKGILFKW